MKYDVSALIFECQIMHKQCQDEKVGNLLVEVRGALNHLMDRVKQLEKEKKQLKKAKLSASMGFDI